MTASFICKSLFVSFYQAHDDLEYYCHSTFNVCHIQQSLRPSGLGELTVFKVRKLAMAWVAWVCGLWLNHLPPRGTNNVLWTELSMNWLLFLFPHSSCIIYLHVWQILLLTNHTLVWDEWPSYLSSCNCANAQVDMLNEATQGRNQGQTTTRKTLRGEGGIGLDWLERKPKESSNGEPLGAGLQTIYTRVHEGCARLCTVHTCAMIS